MRDLLFGDAAGASTEVLEGSLHDRGTVRGLVPSMHAAAAERQVAGATDELLSLNLADVAAQGWKKYSALSEAARRTRDTPSATEVVTLVTHKIESSHHPTVDVTLDGTPLATINIDLQLCFTMAGVSAVIQCGRLMEIRTGTCTVTGSLTVQQISVAKKERKFALPGAIHLPGGIALLDLGPSTSEPTAQDWYSDPTGRYEFRWWDGTRWTRRVSQHGQVMSD
ncbi:hypothetical protein QQ44_09765 [Mycolicibacterium setense]|uniref:DUF2510 domain-containing protein n=1 Tax=Mycolicibacterium setense TaxID=431269 RepID=A0ABR4YV10_9MYCO|nr:hypothetical protein QQ44_09765 [Mycolicibacterium setense]